MIDESDIISVGFEMAKIAFSCGFFVSLKTPYVKIDSHTSGLRSK